MRIRSFIIAYALVLVILLFADRRPESAHRDHYSRVVDLTGGENPLALHQARTVSNTRIIAPGALIPGTWAAGQIPAERLVAPLVVIDLDRSRGAKSRLSLEDIASWEGRHGMIQQGAVVAIRRADSDQSSSHAVFPIDPDAVLFLLEARYTIGFATETTSDFAADRTLARQLALHGSYVVESATRFTSLPPTGSLVIVAPAKGDDKDKNLGAVPVRVLAMVR